MVAFFLEVNFMADNFHNSVCELFEQLHFNFLMIEKKKYNVGAKLVILIKDLILR